MATRDLESARKAYEMGDSEASRKAHLQSHQKNEKHKKSGNFLKSFVYGGLDGVVTTFSIVSGAVGSNLGAGVVVILGLSNVISDALSMAFGDYLSTKSEIEYQKAEKARETWEVENNPEGEMLEMEEVYMSKGMAKEDAEAMSQILSKNKKAWIDVMMVEELGIIEESDDPMKNALVTFFSFVISGIFPLLPFLIGIGPKANPNTLYYISIALTAIVLFAMGAIKTRVTGVNFVKSGIETLVIGATAAGIAYLVGWLLEPLQDS